jgi:hypothetical protein
MPSRILELVKYSHNWTGAKMFDTVEQMQEVVDEVHAVFGDRIKPGVVIGEITREINNFVLNKYGQSFVSADYKRGQFTFHVD